jgi:electron transfer flavoprotein beta subunit
VLAERLGLPLVTIARELAVEGGAVRVTRVTPDGDEVVEADLPAVVTVSNELGAPRYPTAARSLQARRMTPKVVSAHELGLSTEALAPRVTLERLTVPSVHGNCRFLNGTSAAESARTLVALLREERLLG